MSAEDTKIVEAAQSLRDDPSWDKMGTADRHIEARFALQGVRVDPSDANIEAVLQWVALLEVTPPVVGLRVRADNPANPHAIPIEEVEAMLKRPPQPAQEPPAPVAAPPVAREPSKAALPRPVRPVPPPKRRLTKTVTVRERGINADPRGVPLLYRIKLASGAADQELGQVLGVSRAMAHAYVSRRLVERYDKHQKEALKNYVDRVIAELQSVRSDL